MCGDLRRERLDELAGKDPHPEMLMAQWGGQGQKFFVVCQDGGLRVAQFNGHAREENVSDWRSSGWTPADLCVSAYTEGRGIKKTEYLVPDGHRIACLIKRVTNGLIVFNIVTREARDREREVHPRFPVTCTRRY